MEKKILLFLLLFFCRYVDFAHSICSHSAQTRYIVATRQFDMSCEANISSRRHIELRKQHIENPERDLSRCVIVLTGHHAKTRFCFFIKAFFLIDLTNIKRCCIIYLIERKGGLPCIRILFCLVQWVYTILCWL